MRNRHRRQRAMMIVVLYTTAAGGAITNLLMTFRDFSRGLACLSISDPGTPARRFGSADRAFLATLPPASALPATGRRASVATSCWHHVSRSFPQCRLDYLFTRPTPFLTRREHVIAASGSYLVAPGLGYERTLPVLIGDRDGWIRKHRLRRRLYIINSR